MLSRKVSNRKVSKRNKNIRRMLFVHKVILDKNLVNQHISIKRNHRVEGKCLEENHWKRLLGSGVRREIWQKMVCFVRKENGKQQTTEDVFSYSLFLHYGWLCLAPRRMKSLWPQPCLYTLQKIPRRLVLPNSLLYGGLSSVRMLILDSPQPYC